MSLPVTLLDGRISVLQAVSPNGIVGSEGVDQIYGVVDAIPSTYSGSVSAGQNIMFAMTDSLRKVNYLNQTFFLIKEVDIIFIETAPV